MIKAREVNEVVLSKGKLEDSNRSKERERKRRKQGSPIGNIIFILSVFSFIMQ